MVQFRLMHHHKLRRSIDNIFLLFSHEKKETPNEGEGRFRSTGRQCATISLPLGSGGTLLLELFQMHIGIADR